MKKSEEILQQYLDGELSVAKAEELERAMRMDPELDRRYKELLMVHEHLADLPLDKPSANFTQTVLAGLEKASGAVRNPTKLNSSGAPFVFSLILLGLTLVLAGALVASGPIGEVPSQYTDKLVSILAVTKPFFAVLFSPLSLSVVASLLMLMAFDKLLLKPLFGKETNQAAS